MTKFNAVTPPGLGWIHAKLDNHHIDFLWKKIKEGKDKEDVKKTLAGNISKSFSIEDTNNFFYNQVLSPLVKEYRKAYGQDPGRAQNINDNQLKLHGFWANYQYQHEFNPYHHHGGVYSFAIWLKIPTHWEEQNKLSFLKGIKEEEKKASIFEFEYTDMLGGIRNYGYRLEPAMEGQMVLFPAALRHTVYPFYNSKKPRVSVAGNLWFT
tara:strand:+ start:298 stop:924 length:627 start_codon:yes stop_codon:yes gene_type:complete